MTLFFIPPRKRVKNFLEMRWTLCEGAAQEAIAHGCKTPAGAEAVYFGADQPRVTAEMTMPWSALGIAPPLAGASLKAEVAMTSWHRERWMSISGKPPEKGLADPLGWQVMKLADGMARAESRTFRIDSSSGTEGPNRRLAIKLCPDGYRVLADENSVGGTTVWTIRCL